MSGVTRSVLVEKRRVTKSHRRLLIATDLSEALPASPLFDRLDATARVAVLGAYRIPFHGLHTLFGVPRLERELAARTREEMLGFVHSSRLARSRFELLTCRGELRDHVLREACTRGCDLIVLAFGPHRAQQRMVARILDETLCDLVLVQREPVKARWFAGEALLAFGPWAC